MSSWLPLVKNVHAERLLQRLEIFRTIAPMVMGREGFRAWKNSA
jgi:hypothetical protein